MSAPPPPPPVRINRELAEVLQAVAAGRLGAGADGYVARAAMAAPTLTRAQLDEALDAQLAALERELVALEARPKRRGRPPKRAAATRGTRRGARRPEAMGERPPRGGPPPGDREGP